MKQIWIILIVFVFFIFILYSFSIEEGLTDYTNEQKYKELVSPFDENYQTSSANENPDFLAAKNDGQVQVNLSNQRPGLLNQCKDKDNCNEVSSVLTGENSRNVYNVNFKDASQTLPHLVDSNDTTPYQIMCSRYGTFAGNRVAPNTDAGVSLNQMDIYRNTYTLFSNEVYDSSMQSIIQDCFYNERQAIDNICNTATVNYQTYKSSVKTQNVATDINNASKYGKIENGKWGDFTATNTVDGIVNTLNIQWNKCNNANNSILNDAINNCTNTNAFLDRKGYTDCGLDTKQEAVSNSCNTALSYTNELLNTPNISSQSNKIAQSNLALINQWLQFNPIPANNEVTKQKFGEIDASMNMMIEKCNSIYNVCSDNNSIITNSTFANDCHQTMINTMTTKCNTAIDRANSNADIVTAAAIKKRMQTTIDNLLGNSVSANNIAIQNTTSYCINTTHVYDPSSQYVDGKCPTETSTEAEFEKPILNMQQNWSDIIKPKMDSLIERLKIINDYISTYPNILKIKPENIMYGPSGSGNNVSIEQSSIDVSTQRAPVQEVYMMLQSGPKGKPGPKGDTGNKGPPGFDGSSGTMGSPGVWQIPKQYYYTY